MKVKYNKLSVYEALQEMWKQLHGGSTGSTFSMCVKESYDPESDSLTVKHPDIESIEPLYNGAIKVEVTTPDKICSEVMTDPTWKDIAVFFNNSVRSSTSSRLVRINIVEHLIKKELVKTLRLALSE
jgi:hypothetical protein